MKNPITVEIKTYTRSDGLKTQCICGDEVFIVSKFGGEFRSESIGRLNSATIISALRALSALDPTVVKKFAFELALSEMTLNVSEDEEGDVE